MATALRTHDAASPAMNLTAATPALRKRERVYQLAQKNGADFRFEAPVVSAKRSGAPGNKACRMATLFLRRRW
jgi:hypothetical protein